MVFLKTAPVFIFALFLAACNGSSTPTTLPEDDRSTASEIVGATEEVADAGFIDSGSKDTPEETTLEETVVVEAVGPATITDLVVVTGQSNALGSQTTYDPILDAPVDRFYAYTDQGWQPASLRQVWDLGWHPKKGLGDDPHNNFGFHFGKTVALQDPNRVVGLILVTAPGEGISHWDADNYFFNKIRSKALLALNDLPHKSGVDGILWHQGETDWSVDGSNDPELWEFPHNDYYSDKLWQLINNFRAESWFAADRPFICGETAQSPVNARLNALNRDSDPWTACVAGEGLPTYDGEVNVHFTAQSLRQLGTNYAEVYLQMVGRG